MTILKSNGSFETFQKIAELRELHITTARDREFRTHLDRLLQRAETGDVLGEPVRFTSTHETRGIAVIDGPGGGKTSLVDYGLKAHPALKPDANTGISRYLGVRVPSPATLKSLGCEILRQSGYADISERRERWSIWDLVRKRLQLLGIVVLWIDEAHDLFGSANRREVDDILKTLKALMQGDGSVIVVLSGVERLWELAQSDAQVKRRFSKLALPPVSPSSDTERLWKLMESYCEQSGLNPPDRDDLVARLIHGSRGLFGRCIENIINAIEDALLNGDDTLDAQHFAESYAMAEGCDPATNVFLAQHWADIDPDQIPFAHKPSPPRRSKNRKAGVQ